MRLEVRFVSAGDRLDVLHAGSATFVPGGEPGLRAHFDQECYLVPAAIRSSGGMSIPPRCGEPSGQYPPDL